MEIADLPAALTKVRQFIVMLGRAHDAWSKRVTYRGRRVSVPFDRGANLVPGLLSAQVQASST